MTEQRNGLIVEEALRGGQMWSRVLKRGQALRLTDLEGGACVSLLAYNAEQPLERYNMPDTLKAQHISRITAGNVLYSDMGRVLLSVTHDTCGWHDTITGVGNAALGLKKYGAGSYQTLRNEWHRNGRDNLLVELGKFGLGKRDLGATVNCFVKIAPDAEGNLSWVPNHAKAGASLTLRSEMNTLVVLSNTPHPLDPNPEYASKPVKLAVYQSEPLAANDLCKHSCPENERGFALTDAYFS